MSISVIIPVYNAEKYVRQATESALLQPETSEVILVEDCSPDRSLAVCQDLASQSDRVRLVRHPDRRNHGAGASRNLGIQEARSDILAFLDADDYYLPARFAVAGEILRHDSTIDGVYEAIGTHFENADAERRWHSRVSYNLTTMTRRVPPEQLFESQWPIGPDGYCPTGGWVVRKSIFDNVGLFDELILHEDTVMYVKFAAAGKMTAGRLDEPVAMRRVHDGNRILAPRPARVAYHHRILMWATIWRWGIQHLSSQKQRIVTERFIHYAATPCIQSRATGSQHELRSVLQLLLLLSQYPRIAAEQFYWRKLLLTLLGRRAITTLKQLIGLPEKGGM